MANYTKPAAALAATDLDSDARVSFYYRNVLVTPAAAAIPAIGEEPAVPYKPAVYEATPHVGIGNDEYPLSHVGYTIEEKQQLKALVVRAIRYRLSDQGYSEV